MSKDLIDRAALLEQIESLRCIAAEDKQKWRMTAKAIMECIKLAPTEVSETIALKYGYWEFLKPDVLVFWQCTSCRKCHYIDEPRNAFYCPACGARMDEQPQSPHRGIYFG